MRTLALLVSIVVLATARHPAVQLTTAADEFAGPFASWTNLKTEYHAVGDGAADDTRAIQTALTALGQADRSPVLYVPRGTYRITGTLTLSSVLNVSVVGEDPATTALVWDGAAGGTMLLVNGVAYSRIVRLTFNGNRRAATAVEQSWDGARPHFDSGNEYADDRFVDAGHGIRGGFKGHGFAETSVVRSQFIRNTVAGISLGNFNALDLWVWDSRFDGCGAGVTNGAGAGNFHVYNSVFLRSTFSDLVMGNTGGFSARGNYSEGSRAFFVSTAAKAYPASIHLQHNVVVDPHGPAAVDLRNQGPGVLTDNVIRSAPDAQGPAVRWNGADGADLVSIGNTFSVADPLSANGRVISIDDRVAERRTIAATEPTAADWPLNPPREVIEAAAPGARTVDVQNAIDAAVKKGGRAIVHVPYGSFDVASTITIPSSDVQLVGDGYATRLRWTGKGAGPLLRVVGPTRAVIRDIQLDGGGSVDTISAAGIDQPGSRAYLQEVQLRGGKEADLLVAGLTHTVVEARDIGYAYSVTGASVRVNATNRTNIFSGASSGNVITYDISGGAKVLVRDVWYESGAAAGFASVHGAATFTVDGSRVASPVNGTQPAFDIKGLNGNVAIIATHLDDRIVVSGPGAAARVVALGVFDEHTPPPYFINTAEPRARALLLNARHKRTGGPGNRSVPTPDVGPVDKEFVKSLLAHARAELPRPLADLAPGVTDLRMFRVWLQNGVNNLRLAP